MATFRETANDYNGSRNRGRNIGKRNGVDQMLRNARNMNWRDLQDDERWDDIDEYVPTMYSGKLGYDD